MGETKFTEVTKDQYIKFLNELPEGYKYVPNMMASRTDIREVANFDNIIGYRHIPECEGDIDRYYIL